jgi:hypothetical protein
MYLPQPTGGDYELCPAGTHIGVAFRVLDLGTQRSIFDGHEKFSHKILISWELPEELMNDGRPFSVSKRYTWSMHEKSALRKDLEAWRGLKFVDKDFGPTGFNIRSILGKACLLTITHTENAERQYANVTAVSKLMKGMQASPPKNNTDYLWLTPELFNSETFNKLGQGLQGVIAKTPEFAELSRSGDDQTLTEPARDLNDDLNNIPF